MLVANGLWIMWSVEINQQKIVQNINIRKGLKWVRHE